MRPFKPHLRVTSDPRHPRRLGIASDVPLRAHAIAVWAGVPFVALAFGLGQILEPVAGSLIAAALPVTAIVLVTVAWVALPALKVGMTLGTDLVEVQRGSAPPVRLLAEEVASVRLSASAPPNFLAPWRLGDRHVELVPTRGDALAVAVADASQARALATGISALLKAPLRDDTPEAEAAYCLQQALLAAGSLSAAPDPPEGLRLRASLERGWLVLSVPTRSTGRAGVVALAGVGGLLLVAPTVIAAWPVLAMSAWASVALSIASVAWLLAFCIAVSRSQQRSALAVSPLGVRVASPRLGRSPQPVQLVAPVQAIAGHDGFELHGEAHLRLNTSASAADVAWACGAITALAGRPLGGGGGRGAQGAE